MEQFLYGNADAANVLIQMVDEHDLASIENEYEEIKSRTKADFCLKAVKVKSWNKDLSPWEAKAVFGREDFGFGARQTLDEILTLCGDRQKKYFIGGYSLAGLFALWAAYQTEVFDGVAAASPSVWFPGFTQYMSEVSCLAPLVYLSLGDREAKTRNPIMAQVADKIEEAKSILEDEGHKVFFEWNKGNHFVEADIRTAKAYAWLLRDKDE